MHAEQTKCEPRLFASTIATVTPVTANGDSHRLHESF